MKVVCLSSFKLVKVVVFMSILGYIILIFVLNVDFNVVDF